MPLLATAAVLALLAASGASAPVDAQPVTVALATENVRAAQNSTDLVRAATLAVQQGRPLVIPAGRFPLIGPVQLPAGLDMRLDAGTVLAANNPGGGVLRVNARTTLSGGALSNRATQDNLGIELGSGADDVVIKDMAFRGAAMNAIYINQPAISGLRVTGCRFTGVRYGVLLNPGAAGSSDLALTGNVFWRVTADAIELNGAPSGDTAVVRDVVIRANTVKDQRGEGDGAGFGVGLSGVADFEVSGNVFDRVRNEAVHIEDESSDGVVRTNIVTEGGTGGRPAIALYRDTSRISVDRNRIQGFDGSGVETLWDPIGSSSSISIRSNQITDTAGRAIVIAGDTGTGPFTVEQNRIVRPGGVAVGVYGTHARSTVRNNAITLAAGGSAIEVRYVGKGVRVIQDNPVLSPVSKQP